MTHQERQDCANLQDNLNIIANDVEFLKSTHHSLDGRCHCEHVDGHAAQIIAITDQMQRLTAQMSARHFQHLIQDFAVERSASDSQPVEDAVAMVTTAEAETCPNALLRPPEAMASVIAATSANS